MLLLFNMSSLFSETLQTFRISHFERSESSIARSSSEESERNNEVGISTYTRNSQVWVIHCIPQTCDLLVEMSPESSGNVSKIKSKLSAETQHHLANHQLRWQAMACYSQCDCGLEGFLSCSLWLGEQLMDIAERCIWLHYLRLWTDFLFPYRVERKLKRAKLDILWYFLLLSNAVVLFFFAKFPL